MPLQRIRVYEIEITGHLTLQAETDVAAMAAAAQYVIAQPRVLNYALTEHDGFAVPPAPPPPA